MVNWWRSKTFDSRAGIIGRSFSVAWLFIIPYSLVSTLELHLPGYAMAAMTEGVIAFMAVAASPGWPAVHHRPISAAR